MSIRSLVLFSFSSFLACHALCRAQNADNKPLETASYPDADRALERAYADISAAEALFTEPSKPQDREWVKRRLEHLYNVDQKARGVNMLPLPAEWGVQTKTYYRKKLGARIIGLDQANTAEIKQLMKIYRWFPISEFGEEVEKYAWVLVQHADRDVEFQQQVLEILGTLFPKGETSSNSYANLWDRVAQNKGKLQRYGTQGRCVGPGNWQPYEVEDPPKLDERRASVGLSSMAAYLQRAKDRKYCP